MGWGKNVNGNSQFIVETKHNREAQEEIKFHCTTLKNKTENVMSVEALQLNQGIGKLKRNQLAEQAPMFSSNVTKN